MSDVNQKDDAQANGNCADATRNDDSDETTTDDAAETTAADDNDNSLDITAFMEQVEALGGLQAILDAAAKITANEDAVKAGAVERILGLTEAYTDEQLNAMSPAELSQMADAFASIAAKAQTTTTNYSANGVNGAKSSANDDQIEDVPGIGKLRPYQAAGAE